MYTIINLKPVIMKKLNLLLLSVFLCGFALNSNAQSDTREFEQYWSHVVNCDGVKDIISGTVHGHVVDHYNPNTGVFEWYKYNFTGELVRENTGELFAFSFFEKCKMKMDVDQKYTKRFNLRGDQGSHILFTRIWFYDVSAGTWTLTKKVKCL